MSRRLTLTALLTAVVAAVGCDEGKTSTVAASSAPAPKSKSSGAVAEGAMAEARKIYQAKCAACHGATGRGDGPGSKSLAQKPRALSDPSWQGKVDDAHLRKIIVEGGTAVGRSALMPPSPELKDKPEVVDGLVQIVRGLD